LLAQADAITHFRGDAQAVAERYAVSVAEALVEMYPLTGGPSAVFVVCGPGFNGLVGVRAAILLKRAGYSPTVFRPKSSSALADIDVDSQLEASGVSFCDFVPRTLDFYYDIVVDALLGMGFDGEDLRSEYWGIFEVLLNTQLPLVSVDMPTGWDLDNGPRVVDVRAGTFLQPELLVSLGVPKNGAKMFAGSFHYIGGRNTLPVGWMETHGIELPAFRSELSSCALLSSSALPSRSRNGEAYGRPGRFEATLWDSKTRITWVSDEEADDMDIFEYD
jgi:NAD(P)H-hydrate epimerase